jgi:1-acyl-sn-glycerol-3-phosphate acyltransferase
MIPARAIVFPVALLMLRLLVHALAPNLRVTGRNHIPLHGPAIFVPNHLSHVDSALLYAAVRRPMWIMAMREIFDIPLVGPAVRFFGGFPVQRDSADRAALEYALKLLRGRQKLLIYPEGRLSPTEELGTVLPGAALLALEAKVPLIPVGITGSTSLMPYGPTCPRFTLAPIRLHFGAPLDLTDLDGLPRRERRRQATQRMETAIRQATAIAAGRHPLP